jgi:hypothetical protein
MIHMHEVSDQYHGAIPEPETKMLRACDLLGLGAFPVTEDGLRPFPQIPSFCPKHCGCCRPPEPVAVAPEAAGMAYAPECEPLEGSPLRIAPRWTLVQGTKLPNSALTCSNAESHSWGQCTGFESPWEGQGAPSEPSSTDRGCGYCCVGQPRQTGARGHGRLEVGGHVLVEASQE